MRRILTWCLVGAVAALGLAAGIDALRGGEEPEPAAAVEPEPTTTGPAEPPERTLAEAGADLRRAGVPKGRLVYSVGRCGSSVLTLPDLAQRPPRGSDACRFGWAAGRGVETFGSPFAGVRGECTRGRLVLWTGPFEDPELYARERGCDPAVKLDGTVTFVQDGGVRRFVRCPGDRRGVPLLCSRPVLTRAELARQLRRGAWFGSSPRIKELHWLTDQRFAAIVRSAGVSEVGVPISDYLAIFERGRIARMPTLGYADLSGLRPSPSGRLVAAYNADPNGIVVVDRAGEPVQLVLDYGHGIAWSPDEHWIAEATEGGIYVFRANEDSREFIQIPVVARDLLWEEP